MFGLRLVRFVPTQSCGTLNFENQSDLFELGNKAGSKAWQSAAILHATIFSNCGLMHGSDTGHRLGSWQSINPRSTKWSAELPFLQNALLRSTAFF